MFMRKIFFLGFACLQSEFVEFKLTCFETSKLLILNFNKLKLLNEMVVKSEMDIIRTIDDEEEVENLSEDSDAEVEV